MKKLYENTKNFIIDNYDAQLDEVTLDVLTVSVMSLFIRFPEVSKEKMPGILNKIEIYFGNKTIAEMVKDRYSEYPIEEIADSTMAFVTRALSLGDDNKFSEDWSMFVNTCNLEKNVVDVIAKTTHELIHLLRFNGIVDGEKESKIREGISIARCDKTTKTAKRKHYNLEEGVVEHFNIEAMESLFDYISDSDVSFSPALREFKKKFKSNFKPSYEVQRFFLNGLIKDPKFNELLEYSFIDQNEPLSVITYYNNVVGNQSAFTMFSRGVDKATIYADNEDVDNFKKITQDMSNQIKFFLSNKKY